MGRKTSLACPVTQGVALGWANGCPFGAIIPFLFLFLAGCDFTSADHSVSSNKSETQPAISVVESGPVKLTAEIQPAKARLSDEPVLSLTIDSERGVEIEKPPFGEALGSFKIIDTHDPLPKTREGRELVQRIITLEPTATGKQAIDPISVTFRDKRSGADGKARSLATKPLTLEVTSSYTKETPSLSDLHAAAGPMALPWRIPVWVWAILAVAIVLIVMAIVVWRRRKREKAAAAAVLSPEDLARLELEKLAASGLMETDVKVYFVELTAIVRRYIERTTGIRAPEQTTEEFLREISLNSSPRPLGEGPGVRAGPLPEGEGIPRERLKDFLESADLVKFAAYRPRREDIQESFQRAEEFIGLKLREPASSPKEALA